MGVETNLLATGRYRTEQYFLTTGSILLIDSTSQAMLTNYDMVKFLKHCKLYHLRLRCRLETEQHNRRAGSVEAKESVERNQPISP